MLGSSHEAAEIGDKADTNSGEDRNAQQRAEFIDQGGDRENTSHVQGSRGSESEVERPYSITIVIEAEVIPMGNRVALAPNTGKGDIEDALIDKEDPINGPSFEIRECRLQGWLARSMLYYTMR